VDEGSGVATFSTDALLHGTQVDIPHFFVRFVSPSRIESFEVTYSIKTASLPAPTEDSLHFRVQRSA
jgi:hypothetical protein